MSVHPDTTGENIVNMQRTNCIPYVSLFCTACFNFSSLHVCQKLNITGEKDTFSKNNGDEVSCSSSVEEYGSKYLPTERIQFVFSQTHKAPTS